MGLPCRVRVNYRGYAVEGPLGNVASCRRRQDARDASSGTRRGAAKTPRDAAETRQRRGTRPGREKKDARDHPGTEPTTTKDDPGTEPRPAGRERRARDAAQTRDAGPDAGTIICFRFGADAFQV